MKKNIQDKVLQCADFIETFIAILLTIVIAILAVLLIAELKGIVLNGDSIESFNNFLASALSLVVGIEFIKMLCKHTPSTVIEVLLFAMARQLIVQHTSVVDNLIGIVSIAALFAVRKYLVEKE
ncbi:MAG: phosphate-starvation-inducible PsiE family protein [Clostridium perfringens]|nr:phosphate-starvation-inducible PsiE family protein [Clostridium perfringens]